MYGLLNLASLLLGLGAWALPMIAILRKRNAGLSTGISFGLCSLSLLLQICYTQHLVNIGDWSALQDTHYAVQFAACALLIGTAVLNLIASKGRRPYR